jgi:antitoxin (DNA-binding transcriptional repressor) of toxin-antitoxin stability system
LDWLSAGEDIVITQRGKSIARLIPEPASASGQVDWSRSPAVSRNRKGERKLSARESADLTAEAGGKW